MSHRRKKKHPSVPSNPQPKKIDGQTAEEFQTDATAVTGNADSDKHGNGSENQQTDAWYYRWYRKICGWFGWLDANRIIALGTISLGLVGIGSLYLTKTSLDESRQALRPYVSLGRKDGVVAQWITIDDPQASVGIRLFMQNGGLSPALNPAIGLQIQAMYVTNLGALHPDGPEDSYHGKSDGMGFMTRAVSGNDPYSVNSTDNGASIPPQSEYSQDSPNKVSQQQLRLLKKGYRALMLMGMLQYCDEFGNYTCREFMLNYSGGTDTSFNEVSESDCTFMYVYPARLDAKQKYLMPCEQPNERETREKWQRNLLAKEAADANSTFSPMPTPSPSPK